MRILLSLIICLLLMPFGSEAAGARSFGHLTMAEGLPHQQVNCLCLDREGYLWLGTRNGLGRYDGYSVRNYFHNSSDSTSLRHNFVRRVYEDSRGRIWILTIKGLCRYLPETDSFKSYIADKDMGSVVETEPGHLVVGGDAIYTYDEAADTFVMENFAPGYAIAMAQGPEGRLFLSTNEGIYLCDTAFSRCSMLQERVWRDYVDGSVAILPLFTDSRGRLWIGRNSKGAMWYDPRTGRSQVAFATGRVRDFAEDASGNIYAATSEGVATIAPDGSVTRDTHNDALPHSLSDNSVYCVLATADGTLWAGTFYGGANYHWPGGDRFDICAPRKPGSDRPTLDGKVVRMMEQTPDGTLWIATENGGLMLYHPDTDTAEPFTAIDGIGPNIHSLYYDKQSDEMWIGTFLRGLYRRNLRTGETRHYSIKDGIGSDAVFYLAATPDGTVWASTTLGLSRYNRAADRFEKLGHRVLDDTFVYTLMTDRRGNLWAGTTLRGLYRIDRKSGKITQISTSTSPLRLNDMFVTSLAEDAQGNLLVGSNNNGLTMLATGSGKVRQFPELANATICAIVPDSLGSLWVSSATGLYRYPSDGTAPMHFTEADGLPASQMNFSSHFATKDGTLYFGTVDGLFRFNPRELAEVPAIHAPVSVKRLIANGNVLAPTQDERIGYGMSRSLTIEYGANVPGHADAVRYEVRLVEGGDSAASVWKEMGARRALELFDLTPGDYTLQMRASSTGRFEGSEVTAFRFIIAPPFYRTTAAYIVYALLIAAGAGAVWLLMRRRRKPAQGAAEAPQAQGAEAQEAAEAPEATGEAAMSEPDRKFLDELHALVEKNLANNSYSVVEMAAELGISRSLLYTKVKALTGMAPADLLRSHRMEQACLMLKKGYTVSETAYATGFSDPAHFSKMFKKRFGTSPSEYQGKDQSLSSDD